MINIADTGERILPEKESPLMTARHLCAYKFARDLLAGKGVLDIGCGEGYGSYYLSGSSKEVTAIDYNQEIIDHAKNKYIANNLEFYSLDIKDLCSLKGKFDAICSFQVIEHLQDTQGFLKNIKLLLNPAGIFICSTPNMLDASQNSVRPLNRFHVREYLFDEFRQLLGVHFKRIEISGLKKGARLNVYRMLKKSGLFNFLPDPINPVKKFYQKIDCGNFIIVKKGLDTALDFIAVCSDPV
ncbi:MAG: class I SAM-dependent methyltransferase [Candidatus Omnitrophota bacterium]